jgi:hypothetical protein
MTSRQPPSRSPTPFQKFLFPPLEYWYTEIFIDKMAKNGQTPLGESAHNAEKNNPPSNPQMKMYWSLVSVKVNIVAKERCCHREYKYENMKSNKPLKSMV